ncbi:hypothetical protein GCM10011289_19620 [Paludibacterium paludis]|uniref:Uncharacterized protein n=1 Tax=Paludibacterium paludis TaxID=1225769 RepID=A0A918P2M8_9NEIS|nr:hypothetical protein GCM10011289_19620 [Paludibacterium paludis]
MAECGQEARRQQAVKTGSQQCGEVAGDEYHHQPCQCPLFFAARDGAGQKRTTRHDTKSIGGNQITGARQVDGKVGGDVRQKAHDHKFGGADREGGDGQCEQGG